MAGERYRTLNVSSTILDAIDQIATVGVGQALETAFKALEEALGNASAARPYMRAANAALADDIQAAILDAYDENVAAKKHFPSYRVGETNSKGEPSRYSGGALRRALSKPSMVNSSANRVQFIDVGLLDREAKHWYRLNYGAGSAPGRAQPVYDWQLGGQSLGQLTLRDPPSGPFSIPHGIWSTGEGGLPPGFYPRGPSNIPTKGIGARRFLDAGFEKFSERFPIVYGDLLQQFVDDGFRKVGPLKRTTLDLKLVGRF